MLNGALVARARMYRSAIRFDAVIARASKARRVIGKNGGAKECWSSQMAGSFLSRRVGQVAPAPGVSPVSNIFRRAATTTVRHVGCCAGFLTPAITKDPLPACGCQTRTAPMQVCRLVANRTMHSYDALDRSQIEHLRPKQRAI